jgi:hypothetical protein
VAGPRGVSKRSTPAASRAARLWHAARPWHIARLWHTARRRRVNRLRRFVVVLTVVCAVLLTGASSAWAGLALGVVPTLPQSLAVGQTSTASSLTITNLSDGPEAALTITLDAIGFLPSCGTSALSGADCPAGAADPDVLRLGATATGRAGTACAGIGFATSVIDPTDGRYQFAPETPVVLGPSGGPSAACVIDFSVTARKVPDEDAAAALAGRQTAQADLASGETTNNQSIQGEGTDVITITPGAVSIATHVAPASISLGASFDDTATLTAPSGALPPTGAVSFAFYGPADPACAAAPVFAVTVPLTGQTAVSSAFEPAAPGTYAVIATYGGDADYQAALSTCADPDEAAVVSAAAPVNPPGPTPTPSPPPGATPGPPTSQTGPADVRTGVSEFTATVNPEGLPTTAHFEYTVVLPGIGAAPMTISGRTDEVAVGSDFTDHTVTATVPGLLPQSLYRVRAVATNASGVTAGGYSAFETSSDRPPPPPVLGKTFNAAPVDGLVLVRLPGADQLVTPLTDARQLPVGTTFDTRHGTAELTSATPSPGKYRKGSFSGGRFRLLQDRAGGELTELQLVLASNARRVCLAAAASVRDRAKKALPKTDLALLHSSVKGRFETRGRYSAATVRGTIWTTADRCDGTLTSVKRGVVEVDDLVRHRRVAVRAGHAYLARAP